MQTYGVTGELLGTTAKDEESMPGDEHELELNEPPAWKRILSSKPSVSVRNGIAWGTNPPTEPTSTLVLTSRNSFFVDIRFSLTGPSPTSKPHYWAFAGTSSSTFPGDSDQKISNLSQQDRSSHPRPAFPAPLSTSSASPPSAPHPTFPCLSHGVWRRLVDSRGDTVTPDSGAQFLLHNGDCLELGSMINPETGNMEAYQELWTGPAIEDSPTDEGTEGRKDSGEQAVKSLVALLKVATSDAEERIAGMIVRVGDYCQGIVDVSQSSTIVPASASSAVVELEQEKQYVQVERWIRDVSKKEKLWVKDSRSNYSPHLFQDGDLPDLPCLWACEQTTVGEKKGQWEIVEASGW